MPSSDDETMAAVVGLATNHFSVVEVTPDLQGSMLVRLRLTGESGRFAVSLPLPSSPLLKPWLTSIPTDATDAADMLGSFLDEEVLTGCASWAAVIPGGQDRLFELAPYGFRHSDERQHQRLLKASGPDGWWGRINENDDIADTPYGQEQVRLAALPLSYAEVGATRSTLPARYRTVDLTRPVGNGREWFETARERLLTWDAHRRTGMLINADRRAQMNGIAVFEIRVGPWWIPAPVRIIDVIDEPATAGLTYGTLPGHPLRGEERLLITLDHDGTVRAQNRAFFMPATWLARLGRPVVRRRRRALTERYLTVLSYDPVRDARRHQ